MAINTSPASFLNAVTPDPPSSIVQMATIMQVSPLMIQFDADSVDVTGEGTYYGDAVLAIPGPLATGTRVVTMRIGGRWVITNQIGTYDLTGAVNAGVNDLRDITIPKYASSAAATADQPSPAVNNLVSIGAAGFYYQSPVTGALLPFGPTLQAFRTTTFAYGTTSTNYCTVATVNPGTYHMLASVGLNNTSANLTSCQLDFTGTATAKYTNWAIGIGGAGTIAQTPGVTALSQAFGGSLVAHPVHYFDGVLIVTATGSLSLSVIVASGTRTADAGGYIQLQKWA